MKIYSIGFTFSDNDFYFLSLAILDFLESLNSFKDFEKDDVEKYIKLVIPSYYLAFQNNENFDKTTETHLFKRLKIYFNEEADEKIMEFNNGEFYYINFKDKIKTCS